MQFKHSFISILIIFLTGNSAAQFGSELGGDTLQESFVNFMQSITLVDITSVAAAFLFLAVVALFYFASLNIFEQVFLRIEEIIKEALGEDSRSIYRDNDHYPTGVKGMALAVGFISANGITGLIGLIAGIAIGLISVFIPLVVQGKLLGIISNTRIDEEGNLTHTGGTTSGSRRRRTPNPSGGDVNINGDPTMDPQEVVNIIHVIENAEKEIQEVEKIEEEEYNEAERAKDKLEEEISKMEEKLEEDVTEKIKEILRYKNKSDSNIAKYLEDPEGNKHEIRRINFSSRSDRKEKRTLSGKVSRNIDNLESRAESLEKKISNNEFGADYEALNKLEKIKMENHEIFKDYKAAIQHIKQEATVSDDINQILKEVTKPKNLKYAGYTDIEHQKQIDEMVKDFKEQKEKMESIEGSVDKVNKILNDEDLPELDAIRKKTELRRKLVGYLLNEDKESALSGDQIKSIKNTLEYGESIIGKVEDKEESELEKLREDHKQIHQGLLEVEEELDNEIDPEIRSILKQHGVDSGDIDNFLSNPEELKSLNISKDPNIVHEEAELMRELEELFNEMEREKQVDNRDYSEIQNLVKENHSILNGLRKMKKDIENTSGSGQDFETTLKEFTEKANWTAAGLNYDKNAAKLAKEMIEDVEEVEEFESIAESLKKAFEDEKSEIEAIESKLKSRHNLMEYLADKDRNGGADTGNSNSGSKSWDQLLSNYKPEDGWEWWNKEPSKMPPQGWKIHIGADPENKAEALKIVRVLSPVLKSSNLMHKFAPSYSKFNGISNQQTKGKIATIYPFPDKGRDLSNPKDFVNSNKNNTENIISQIVKQLQKGNILEENYKVTSPGEKCVVINGKRTKIYVRYAAFLGAKFKKSNGDFLRDNNGNKMGRKQGVEHTDVGAKPLNFNLTKSE